MHTQPMHTHSRLARNKETNKENISWSFPAEGHTVREQRAAACFLALLSLKFVSCKSRGLDSAVVLEAPLPLASQSHASMVHVRTDCVGDLPQPCPPLCTYVKELCSARRHVVEALRTFTFLALHPCPSSGPAGLLEHRDPHAVSYGWRNAWAQHSGPLCAACRTSLTTIQMLRRL